MCLYEILHLAPLGLIALSLLILRSPANKLALSATVIILSIVGLIAGSHMHTEHFEPISLIDPCYGYMISLAISTYVFAKGGLEKLAQKGEKQSV